MLRCRSWLQDNDDRRLIIRITVGILVVVVYVLIGRKLLPHSEGYETHLYTHAAGILLTILVLDELARHREKKRLKAQLIREMASGDNGIAVRALKEFKAQGWLKEESLENVDLSKANLQRIEMEDADLQGVILKNSNLEEAILKRVKLNNAELGKVNLKKANLSDADLEHAWLYLACLEKTTMIRANLQQANLRFACLAGAVLVGAHLEGANLEGASLSGANLKEVYFDERTILPDGKHWIRGTDICHYTTPNK